MNIFKHFIHTNLNFYYYYYYHYYYFYYYYYYYFYYYYYYYYLLLSINPLVTFEVIYFIMTIC